jgi:sporulation protein YlmC with PRC-barrel domain
MRLCELKGKTVINDTDCCILGFVVDIDFDPSSGCILALIVPGPARLCYKIVIYMFYGGG